MADLIRIMIVDDHAEIHRALSSINDLFDDLRVVAHASNGREAISLCAQEVIDVIFMDVIMPVMGGIEATQVIHERYPHIKIFALSSFQVADDVRSMLRAGAVGYLLKNASIDELAHTIRAAQAGTTVLSPEVASALLDPHPAMPTQDYGLTPRELEVLALMIKGLNNKEIAFRLTVSIATVKFHISGIFTKLQVSSRVEAVTLALEKKLVS